MFEKKKIPVQVDFENRNLVIFCAHCYKKNIAVWSQDIFVSLSIPSYHSGFVLVLFFIVFFITGISQR